MFGLATKRLALILFSSAVALFPVVAVAQSSGGSGGGSSGGSSAGSAGGSTGGGVGRGAGSPSTGRSLGGSSRAVPGTPNTNPNGFRNNAAPTTAPGTRTPAQENTRQRAMDLRNSEPPATQPTAPGDTRGRTSDVGQDDEQPSPNSGALPERVSPGRSTDLNELSAGGSPRQGAVGRTMAECEGAWDAQTHMSKEKWRETCRRTLTDPHL